MTGAVTGFRAVRPVRDVAAARRFYVDLLELRVVYGFQDKDGFDGLIVDAPGGGWQIALTREIGRRTPPATDPEDQLVFYLPDADDWRRLVERLERAGHRPVRPNNPYWSDRGATFEDADGHRVVLHNAEP